jgi:hypothetical protein
MKDDSTIIQLRQPGLVSDPLTEIAREGAQRMLKAELKAEADCFVEMFSTERFADGRQRVVRHQGYPAGGSAYSDSLKRPTSDKGLRHAEASNKGRASRHSRNALMPVAS